MIRNVAVPAEKHSPRFGHFARLTHGVQRQLVEHLGHRDRLTGLGERPAKPRGKSAGSGHYRAAIASISTRASLGRPATATVERAGNGLGEVLGVHVVHLAEVGHVRQKHRRLDDVVQRQPVGLKHRGEVREDLARLAVRRIPRPARRSPGSIGVWPGAVRERTDPNRGGVRTEGLGGLVGDDGLLRRTWELLGDEGSRSCPQRLQLRIG